MSNSATISINSTKTFILFHPATSTKHSFHSTSSMALRKQLLKQIKLTHAPNPNPLSMAIVGSTEFPCRPIEPKFPPHVPEFHPPPAFEVEPIPPEMTPQPPDADPWLSPGGPESPGPPLPPPQTPDIPLPKPDVLPPQPPDFVPPRPPEILPPNPNTPPDILPPSTPPDIPPDITPPEMPPGITPPVGPYLWCI